MPFKNYLYGTTLSVLLMVSIVAAERMIEREMVDALRRSITPEKHAWYQKQHLLYRQAHPDKPLIRSGHYTAYSINKSSRSFFSGSGTIAASGAAKVERVLILANKTLYENPEVKEKVDRYMEDIGAGHGCTVEIEILEGGTAVEIKDILKSYYSDGGLDGVIQIGSFPVGWMEFRRDPFFGKYETWTCDHFYMDLDGEWIDADGNGFYEANNDGSGDRSPEIFYARIDVAPMRRFGTETELLCSYLDKVHAYWKGEVELGKSACELVEKDWAQSDQYLQNVYGRDNTETFRYGTSNPVSRDDYLDNRLTKDYTLLHLWCHSSANVHFFTNGGELDFTRIINTQPKPVGYFHDGCSLADWAAANGRGYLGGAYVFNESPTALVCMAGTRTGQWMGTTGRRMFEELALNTCLGKAYQIWFDDYIKRDMNRDPAYFMAWNYGYVLIGDPMLTFINRPVTETRGKNVARTTGVGIGECFFDNTTRKIIVNYALPETDIATISLFDLSGREITRRTGSFPAGRRHSLLMDVREPGSGVYIVKIHSNTYSDSRNIYLLP